MPPDLDSSKHFQLICYRSATKHQDLLVISEEKSSNPLPCNREPGLTLVALQGTCKCLLLVW